MKKIATVVGARPQFIKASVLSRIVSTDDEIEEVLIHTGQHYDVLMSEVFFRELELPQPHYHLEVGSHDHGKQTGLMLEKLEELFNQIKPHAVLVYGDTNSTLAGALAAAKKHLPVFHVEAGLRSFEKNMPEEINRIITDHLSTLLFCPTQTAVSNLAKEGIFHHHLSNHDINHPGVFLTGDIMYDVALFYQKKASEKSSILQRKHLSQTPFFLLTLHRSENTDNAEKLQLVIELLEIILSQYRDHLIFFPVHPRAKKMLEQFYLLEKIKKLDRLILSDPVSYLDMIQLESAAVMVLTDSGGVQKEAYFFRKPCLILRSETEWIEIINQGKGYLWNYDNQSVLEKIAVLLNATSDDYPPVFGQGKTASSIVEIIKKELA